MRPSEALSQLRTAGERQSVTPLRRRVALLDNLPLQLTRFIGREDQLAQLRTLLESARLLTLTGSGGIGKTRLALELAGSAREHCPDGVWLVDLSSLAQPELVAQAVAEPLGVRSESEVPLQAALLEFLRGRQLLLVLDNCEHLIHACASIVETILRTCPAVHVLATSREPLHVPGENVWRVPPLSLAAASLGDCEAVRLFADRALASTRFVVDADNLQDVAKLCAQLDGIPLAIELAAVRTGVLSLAQIGERLSDRFRLLVGGGRTAPARQQTLRAAIDWSYELLPEAERRLLNCLSVFAGGWTLEAAERIGAAQDAPSDDVFELMARLVDKSLVQVDPGSAPQVRYRLLESVRDYARERLLASGEAPATMRRHCAYYAAVAAEAEQHLLWGAGALDWLTRLDRELANLRVALAWSLSEDGEPRWGLRLAAQLGHYWYTRADRGEGRGWLKRALVAVPLPPDDAPPEARAAWTWAQLWAGGLAHGQSDYDEAAALVGDALESFARAGEPRGIGWALSFLGNVARARSELPEAAAYFERAIAAFREIDDEISIVLPLAALSFTVCLLGDQPRASRLAEESIDLARRTGSTGRLAIAYIYCGQVAVIQGDTRRALTAFQDALALFREWGSVWGMAECLEGLAVVAGLDGAFERAARLLGAAAQLRESIGAPVHPVDRTDHERTVAASRTALGTDSFARAWDAGRAMTKDEVMSLATSRDMATPVPVEKTSSALTSREREVAALIARGLSNRQIAETLVIAERTVTNHVEHIFDKLGFRSRAQVATWITEQQR